MYASTILALLVLGLVFLVVTILGLSLCRASSRASKLEERERAAGELGLDDRQVSAVAETSLTDYHSNLFI